MPAIATTISFTLPERCPELHAMISSIAVSAQAVAAACVCAASSQHQIRSLSDGHERVWDSLNTMFVTLLNMVMQ